MGGSMHHARLAVTLGLFASACLSSSNSPSGGNLDAGAIMDAGANADGISTLDDAAAADSAAAVDGSVPSPCPTPTGGPTLHGGTVNTETWAAADSPHVFRFDTTIYGTLTIEGCSEVQLPAGMTL